MSNRWLFVVLFFFICDFIIPSQSTICAQVKCKPTDFLKLSSASCAAFEGKSNIVTLAPCPGDQECDVTPLMLANGSDQNFTASCLPSQARSALRKNETKGIPGDDCSRNTQCYSGICENGKCQGLGLGETCLPLDGDIFEEELQYRILCGNNLLCDIHTLTCRLGNRSDETCMNHSECAGLSMCLEGRCVGVGSLSEGSRCLSSMQCGTDLYCKSGVCSLAGHYRKSSYNQVCESDSDCYPARCECTAPNSAGLGLCGALSPGDFGRDYLNWQRDSYRQSPFNCPLSFKDRPLVMSCWPQPPEKFVGLPTENCYQNFSTVGSKSLIKKATYLANAPRTQWPTWFRAISSAIVNLF